MADSGPLLAFAVQAAGAVTLIVAGGLKLAQPTQVRATLGALGVPRAPWAAAMLGVAEVGAGVGLILAPGNFGVAAWVLALGGAFATAGMLAILRRMNVDCACFGPALAGRLGWRQLVLAPAWVAVAASMAVRPILVADQRAQLTAGVLILVALGVGVRLGPLALEHRMQRRILEGR